jgi:cyclase
MLLTEIADVFGAQCCVVAIDAKRNYSAKPGAIIRTPEGDCWFEVHVDGGRTPTGLDAAAWAREAVRLGAGEVLLTSIDRDGTGKGYDIPLTREVSRSVNVPVVASGGAGEPAHFLEVFKEASADAVLAATVFHYGNYPVPAVKQYLKNNGVNVRT